jgi:putative transposase
MITTRSSPPFAMRQFTRLGLEVVKTPVRSPQANALCERLIGTLRRECLDWLIR